MARWLATVCAIPLRLSTIAHCLGLTAAGTPEGALAAAVQELAGAVDPRWRMYQDGLSDLR
jgi:ABC-type Fe3+ transport system permease subunit